MFRHQIGKDFEVYVDDIVIKSKKAPDFPKNLRETPEALRIVGLKLNPSK